jgi:hypothetical protein
MKAIPNSRPRRYLRAYRNADPGYYFLVQSLQTGTALLVGVAFWLYFRPPNGTILLMAPFLLMMVTGMLSTQKNRLFGLLFAAAFIGLGNFFCAALYDNKILILLFVFFFVFFCVSIPAYRGVISLLIWFALLATSPGVARGWHQGVNVLILTGISLLIVLLLYFPFSKPYLFTMRSILVQYGDGVLDALAGLLRQSPHAPGRAAPGYDERMARFSAVALKANLLIRERQYLLQRERTFAEEISAILHEFRRISYDLSFLRDYPLVKDRWGEEGALTHRVLLNMEDRIARVLDALRGRRPPETEIEEALYHAWQKEEEARKQHGDLSDRARARVFYGMACLDKDIGRLEQACTSRIHLFRQGRTPAEEGFRKKIRAGQPGEVRG